MGRLFGTTRRTGSVTRAAQRVLLAVAAVLSLAGCPGEIENPMAFRRAPARPACTLSIDVEQDILARRCATVGCHAASAMPQAGLDLASPGIVARMINAPASSSSSCRGRGPLVRDDDPTAGLFYDKLAAMPACGGSMPPGGPVLSEAEINCLRAYVFDRSRFGDGGTSTDASTTPPRDGGGTDATTTPPRDGGTDASTQPPEGGTG